MLKTACSAIELCPMSKTMDWFERRAFSTSPRAAARSSLTGAGLRLMRA